MVRGNNRRTLFSYPRDRLAYLRLLAAAVLEHGLIIHALCLMLNHIHLLLTPPTVEAVSKAMKRVNQRYAQVRNSQRDGSGKLFEQAFESKPIESLAHLANAVMYIDANPHRAGLKSAATYRWSSFDFHTHRRERGHSLHGLLAPDEWYLGLGDTPAERGVEYGRLFADYLQIDEQPPELRRFLELEQASAVQPRRPNGGRAA